MSVSYYKLAVLLHNNKNSRDAIDYLKQAIGILEMLVKATDAPRYRENLDIMKNFLNKIKGN